MLYLELIVPEGGGLLQGAIVPRDAPPNPPSLGLVIKEIIRVQTRKDGIGRRISRHRSKSWRRIKQRNEKFEKIKRVHEGTTVVYSSALSFRKKSFPTGKEIESTWSQGK